MLLHWEHSNTRKNNVNNLPLLFFFSRFTIKLKYFPGEVTTTGKLSNESSESTPYGDIHEEALRLWPLDQNWFATSHSVVCSRFVLWEKSCNSKQSCQFVNNKTDFVILEPTRHRGWPTRLGSQIKSNIVLCTAVFIKFQLEVIHTEWSI